MRKIFKIVIITGLFALTSRAQENKDYPFILNDYNSNKHTFAVKVAYSYNNLGNAWFLMKEFDYFEPTSKKNTCFYSYDIMFFYDRFWIKMGSLMKTFTSGGTYAKGWDDNGNMILGYDQSKAVAYIKKEIYFAVNVVPFVRRYHDIGFTYNSISHIVGVVIGKSFNRFSYSFNFSRHLMMWATFKPGGLYAMSLAFRPSRKIEFFDEFVYHTNDGLARSGYVNIFGLSFKTVKNCKIVLYNHFYYDNIDYYVPYDRVDYRYGFQINIKI